MRSLQSELTRPPSGGLFLCLDKYSKSIIVTNITTKQIETYLKGLGRMDSKKKILFQRVLFDIKTTKTGVEIILDSPDTEAILKNFKSQMIKTLTGTFKGSLQKEEKQKPRVGKVLRLKYSDKGIKYIDLSLIHI